MTASAKLVALANFGKGHIQNAITKLIDVLLSTDAGNVLTFGNDNGLLYVPARLSLQKKDFFTATSLVSNNAGWTKDARAKWITAIAVGGGASGSCSNTYNQTSYGGGGEPGSVELYSGPASDFPATADIIIGAGGATPTTSVTSNDGGSSQFGTLLKALGGRGYVTRKTLDTSGGATNGFMNMLLPICSFRLGIPGNNVVGNASVNSNRASDSAFGPGAGASISGGLVGVAGGAASTNRPQSTVAGGASISSPANNQAGNNGGNAVAGDPLSFGSGGGTGGPGGTGGNGGIPGGGGAGSNNPSTNSSSYFVAPGSGGRGEIRIISYW